VGGGGGGAHTSGLDFNNGSGRYFNKINLW